jgi:hypothetical protein
MPSPRCIALTCLLPLEACHAQRVLVTGNIIFKTNKR